LRKLEQKVEDIDKGRLSYRQMSKDSTDEKYHNKKEMNNEIITEKEMNEKLEKSRIDFQQDSNITDKQKDKNLKVDLIDTSVKTDISVNEQENNDNETDDFIRRMRDKFQKTRQILDNSNN